MFKNYLSLDFQEFKKRFNVFVQHKKKIKALENLDSTGNFHKQTELHLLKKCLQKGFLSEKAEAFLEELLDECQINYLEWFHKTKWLKSEMERLSNQKSDLHKDQMLFDFDKEQEIPSQNVPLNLLKNKKSAFNNLELYG
jgi:hypothetical protein